MPELIAGVDEAGRGALAGPVVSAAVILGKNMRINGVTDSKKLSPAKRSELSKEIKLRCKAWAVGVCSVEEIEHLNILQATMVSMKRAVESLSIQPDFVLIDGNRSPSINILNKAVVGGDAIVAEISAASVIAKVFRDQLMCKLSLEYPQYEFNSHFGYGTKKHLSALHNFGVTPVHRRSFAPVRQMLDTLI